MSHDLAAHPFVFLVEGRLFQQDPAETEAREVQSAFAEEIRSRMQQINQRRDWKTKGRGSLGVPSQMLWGVEAEGGGRMPPTRITGVCGDGKGRLVYTLSTEQAGGLLSCDLSPGAGAERVVSTTDAAEDEESAEAGTSGDGRGERRHFHKEHLFMLDLDAEPERGLLTTARRNKDGSCSIVVMNLDGSELREITEGDSVDELPSWAPQEKAVIYQSAGVARTEAGFAVGLAPMALFHTEVDSGEVETLYEEADSDLLQPHLDAAGRLYFIRRPYEGVGIRRSGLLDLLKDVALFPFRMVRALFGFMNFFSMVFSNKPLTTSGGPQLPGQTMKMINLRGKMINAQKVYASASKDKEAPALVPASWQLVRKAKDGAEEVLAKQVVAYDLHADGTLLFTNGSTIFQLGTDGRKCRVGSGVCIEQVKWV